MSVIPRRVASIYAYPARISMTGIASHVLRKGRQMLETMMISLLTGLLCVAGAFIFVQIEEDREYKKLQELFRESRR